jgi:TonB family protein
MFQDALIEPLSHRSWRLRTILTSASLHALALGPLVWISLQTIREIEDPALPIVFIVGGDPPPLGDGGSDEAVSRPRKRLARLPRTVAHPEEFQPTRPTVRDEDQRTSSNIPDIGEEKEAVGAYDGNGKIGEPDGVNLGTGQKDGPRDGTRNDALSPERVDQAPFLISRIEPIYPEAARQHHLSGIVVLQAIIDTSGRVEDLSVVKSAGALLDAAALSAVERWIYRPAMLNGRPVRVRLAVNVEFALH